MRPSVFIAEPEGFDTEAVAMLRGVADVVLEPCDDIAAALARHEVVWLRLGHRIGAAELGEAPRCRIIATPVTGLDHIDLEACAARGIQVLSLRGERAFLREVRATAEHTLLLAMALMRRLVPAAGDVKDARWDRDRFRGHELYRKTAGVVGVGRLGAIVAEYLSALGMRVLGHDPHVDVAARGLVSASLSELLQAADLVTLHVPLAPETLGLIGEGELRQMKSTAVLVNTSRGGIVDEAALLAALKRGSTAGAALDVVAGEPESIRADSPLVGYASAHDNLLITPHIGGNTFESFEKTERFIATKVIAALRQLEASP